MQPSDRGIIGRTAASTALIPVDASVFADSLQNKPATVAGVSIYQPNCLGILRLSVGRGVTQLTVFVANDLFTSFSSDCACSVYVDGAWLASQDPTAQGVAGFVYLLDGSPHVVEIVSPYQQYDSSTPGQILGGFIYRVTVAGGEMAVLPNPTVPKRLSVYGDSISCGALATPDSKSGWLQLLRQTFPGRISLEAWGGRSLWDDSGAPGGYGFPSLSALATRLIDLGFSAPTVEIYDAMGANDWDASRWSAASFGSGCATLYDAIHSAAPSINVFAQTPIITNLEATTNTYGETIGDYRSAKAAAATGRSWVTLVDGPSLMSAANLSADGLHPTTAGHAQLASNIGPLV